MKAFTDISQSKKLAEILPLESADMCYPLSCEEGDKPLLEQGGFGSTSCWSLAALLEQLDDEITDEDGNDYHLTIVKESLQYQLYYHDSWGQVEDIETNYYDDFVDACYEMIIKLHEQNLL